MNSFNEKPLELFIFLYQIYAHFKYEKCYFVKSDTFAVKVGQKVGQKFGGK